MIRNLKATGLALVAVFAMSAFVASAAQAAEFHAESYPVTYSGEQTAGAKHVFTLTDNSSLKTECTSAVFTGSATGTSGEAKVHPVYTGCTSFGLSANINTESCDYRFDTLSSIATDRFHAQVDMIPASGFASCVITINAGLGQCVVKVDGANNQNLTTVEVQNTTNSGGNTRDIDVNANVSNINYTVTTDGFLCPLSKVGEFHEADYTGGTTVQGFSGTEANGIWAE